MTIIQHVDWPKGQKHRKCLCRCDCGTEKLIQITNLKRTHSCGCIKVEILKAKATHGMRRTPEYKSWMGMIGRCSRPYTTGYEDYGGRGITVCQEWLSFKNFHADMGFKPSPKHSLDRIDNNGNYEPSNCRWATREQQNNNQRKSKRYTFDGMTGSLKDFSRHFDLSYTMLRQRLDKLGWPLEKALTTPNRLKKLN